MTEQIITGKTQSSGNRVQTMPSTAIGQDEHEPATIAGYIRQTNPVNIVPLNSMGFADWMWYDCKGRVVQLERKQAGELLGSLDAVEEQLQRELVLPGINALLIQGFFLPVAGSHGRIVCQELKAAQDSRTYYKGRTFEGTSYDSVQAWLWQLQQKGVSVVWTADDYSTASAIVSIFKNSQKPEHNTLNRHIKLPVMFNPNPHVISLMGLQRARIGETTALRLIDAFGSFWKVVSSPKGAIARLPGFGAASEKTIWDSIGRTE